MSESPLLTATDERGIATLTLNRPHVHNAFDDTLASALAQQLQALAKNPAVRALVLAANGKSFCAGADLNWMQRMAGYSEDENYHDAMGLAELLHDLNTFPKPTLAVVHGPAYGGGLGLVACCDIALAVEAASFSFSEVKLGLVPAVIAPYVMRAIGARQARRYFLTAERFDAAAAQRLGLVHEVVGSDELSDASNKILQTLLSGGPAAQAACKDLIAWVAGAPPDDQLIRDTAQRIARARASAEGREGIEAFLAKRKPAWRTD